MTCALNYFRALFVLAAIWLAFVSQVSAAPPEVRDDASFFSPTTVSRANADIQEIKRLYKKDLHFETFPAPPANLKDSFQKNQSKAFADWAASQAAKSKIDGIYVLISKAPAHLEIVVDIASLKKAFLAKDRDKLRDDLLARFREKAYDKGLAEATALVRERFEQNLGPPLPATPLNAVQDRAFFFSPQVVSRINLEMKEFQQRFKKDLVIETFTTPPADKQKLLSDANPADKTKILASWLHQRAKESKADGIAVLICREPPRIQVEVSAAMSQKAFSTEDRDHLVELLVGHFKGKEFDKALETTLDFVYDAVDRNLTAAPAPLALGTITDRAALFSAAAMQRASQDIAAIAKNDRQTLTIETFSLPPAGQVKRVEAMNAETRNAFFAGWLKERMQSVKFNGIYLLICKQPGNLQIGVGDATQLKIFTQANRSELAKIMSEQFQAKQFDLGLFKGLDFISVTLAVNGGGLAILDDAGLFKVASLLAANREIQVLRQKEGQEIRIETAASLPADKKLALARLATDDEKSRKQVFADWQTERAKAAGSPGIHVLICQDPPQVLVAVQEASEKKLGPADRDQLRSLLASRIGEKDADTGLTEAIAFLRDTLPVRSIRDEGGFFSAEALEKANTAVRDLRRRFQKEVLVESFNEVPADRTTGVDLKDASARGRVFAAWAEDRRKSLHVDGLSILICKKPMHLQVVAAPNGAFADQRDDVANLLLARLKEKQYDAGLAQALQFINQTLQKKLPSTPPQEAKVPIAKTPEVEPKAVAKDQNVTEPVKAANKQMAAPSAEAVSERVGFDVMWVVWGFAILGGLWLVIGILRALFGAGKLPPPPPPKESIAPIQSAPPAPMSAPPPAYGSSPYPQKPYPQPSPYPPQQPYPAPQQTPPLHSGGGVLPSLLGGLFGGVAGGWMYDRFRSGGSGHASVSYSSGSQPSPATYTPAPQPPLGYKPPPPPADVGYSSSGGDFGAPAPDQTRYASSGGDFGHPTPEQPDYATSGGDFGQPIPPQPDYASTGGDFAQPALEPPDTINAGGDFDAPSRDVASSGGDFGAPEIPIEEQAFSGGDFAPPPDPPANDWTAPEAGGGDFGGGASSEG